MNMRSILFAAALSLGAGGAALAHDGEDHAQTQPAKTTTTLTGEVMDLVCYLNHPATGQGPSHAGCAKQCINKGLPAGLKVGDQLYLLMAPGHGSIADKVAPLAGKQATVTGTLLDQDGMKAIVVDTVSPAG
jgi:hypothetical protein